jgi:hypothetical protein
LITIELELQQMWWRCAQLHKLIEPPLSAWVIASLQYTCFWRTLFAYVNVIGNVAVAIANEVCYVGVPCVVQTITRVPAT